MARLFMEQIQIKLKENSCQCNLGQNNQAKIKLDSIKEAHTQKTESLKQVKTTRVKMVRNQIWLGLKMLEHQSRKRFQHQVVLLSAHRHASMVEAETMGVFRTQLSLG